MIKLFSFIIFIIAFIWSWTLFNQKNSIGVDVHAGIQIKLARLIEETIKSKKPSSSAYELLSISTEKIDDHRIKATFSFKYDENLNDIDKTTQILTGDATLNKGLSENPEIQKWIIQSIKTNAAQLEFQEGLVISSDGNDESEQASAPPIKDNTEKDTTEKTEKH
jgi:hypothetical protein